ncbi:MAG: 2-hydroxyacyl-CoA dehydratase family protein [Actinomycetota bacterium]|nr:2-hydroxyacyl-CoA dehydratase family protein [Actinomycetota bacterium]
MSAIDELAGIAWGAAPGRPSRPVIGVIGRDVPLELVEAAGAAPLTLRGDPSIDLGPADTLLGTGLDPAARAILAQLLGTGFAGLDALVACTDCEGSVRVFYALRELARVRSDLGIPPVHLVDVAHLPRESSRRYTTLRLAELRAVLSDWTGRAADDDRLADAIVQRDEVRRRLVALDALRRRDPPWCTGSELLAAATAARRATAAEVLPLLDRVLTEAGPPDRTDGSGRTDTTGGRRVLLTGSAHGEPGVTAAIEASGGVVVADDHPTGALGLDLTCESPTLEALAARTAADGVTPQRGRTADRAAQTARLVAERDAEVVIAYVRCLDEAPLWDAAAQRDALDVPLVLLRDQDHGAVDRDALAAALDRATTPGDRPR